MKNVSRWRHDPQATHLEKKKTNDELNFVLRPLDIALVRSSVVYKVS